MAQLVSPQITLINTMSNTLLDRAGVKNKFDVFPEQIIDYLALVGDSSDNIPGIDKVGPKTAAKWLAQYDTLDKLVADAANVSGKVGENLRAGLDTLELARKLATIRTDLTLPLSLDDLKRKPPDVDALRTLYTRLELRSLLQAARWRRAAGDSAPRRPAADASGAIGDGRAAADRRQRRRRRPSPRCRASYETIMTEAQLDEWLAQARGRGAVRLRHRDHQPRIHAGARSSACRSRSRRARPPICRCGTTTPALPSSSIARRAWRSSSRCSSRRNTPSSVITSSTTRTCSRATASSCAGMRYDSMLESYVWNSVVRHDMDSAAERYLGITHDSLRRRRRQGRQADSLQPGAGRQGGRVFRRGRRRHAAPAPGAVAADCRRAGAQVAVRGMRAAAGAGAAAHGRTRRAARPADAAHAEL